MTRQHVYAIATDDGFMKIGVAANPPARLTQLQTGNHRRLRLVADWPIANPECQPLEVERRLHQQLAPRKSSGEWFWADERALEAAVQAVSDAMFDSVN